VRLNVLLYFYLFHRFSGSSRAAPSGSSLRSTTSFHTSASLQVASLKRHKTQASEKTTAQKRAERGLLAETNRPHIVLGHRPGDTAKWSNCDLAKVIIRQDDVAGTTRESLATGSLHMPKHFNYGIGEQEKDLLFEALPQLTIENISKPRPGGAQGVQRMMARHNEAGKMELLKLHFFSRAVSLRNANAKGIAYENRRRIIAEFSEPANPEDPGRPEVQGM
jgi:small subunit ribosomal protein S15